MTGYPSESPTATLPRAAGAAIDDLAEADARWIGLRRLVDALRTRPAGLVGLAILLALILVTIGAPLLTRISPLATGPDVLLAPGQQHWFGTDQFGRDVFSRVLFGGQISLRVGFVSVAMGVVIGTATGLIAGFYRGAPEMVLMRLVDALMAFPELLLALAISAVV